MKSTETKKKRDRRRLFEKRSRKKEWTLSSSFFFSLLPLFALSFISFLLKMASALRPAVTGQQLLGQQQHQRRPLLLRNLSTTTTTTSAAIPHHSQPTSGTAEFEDGSGVALFRAPASLPPLRRQAPGKPGVAEFSAGGKAAFASR